MFYISSLYCADSFTMIYDVSKGAKNLGTYEITIDEREKKLFSSNSGVSDKIKFFTKKEITYIDDGHRQVEFSKNQKIESFELYTQLSSIDKKIKKEFNRKLVKVKQNSMLLITKTGKKKIELFNKRKVIIKTLDEVLVDILNDKVSYDKFILFDKLGVMKMVANISKNKSGYTIINRSKKSDYIGIAVKDNKPHEVKSLVSNWKMKLIDSGINKRYSIDILKSMKDNLSGLQTQEIRDAKLNFDSKLKTTKKYYATKIGFKLELPSSFASKKNYEKAEYCKKVLKKSGLKHQKILINDTTCSTILNIKIDRKKYNKKLVDNLSIKHKELKNSKRVTIKKSTIEYQLLSKGQK